MIHGVKLSILIVNWNTRDLVLVCLESILKNPPARPFEIVVVDNGSADGSAAALKERFGGRPNVKIIVAAENLGFAAANNLAYQNSSGEYVFLLNPDTAVQPGALTALTDYLDGHAAVGAVGPKILNPDGTVQPSVRRFPKIWSSLLVISGLHRLFRPHRYLADDFDYSREAEVQQVMGAALLTRRAVIDKVGGLFDERFWLWYEEVDFCRRVKTANFKIIYYPRAAIMHHGAAGFSQMAVFARKKAAAESLRHYFRKHGARRDVIFLNLTLPPILLIAKIMSLFRVKTKIHV